MKKIFVLLILLGTYLFVSVDLFASSYNDPISNQTITIDTPITMLNNESLQTIFGDGNVLNNYDFTDGFNSWNSNAVNYIINNDILEFTATAQFGQITQSGLNLNVSYYTFANVKATTNLAILAIFTGSNPASHSGNNQFELISSIEQATGQNGTISILDIRTSNFDTIYVDYVGAIDLDYWGIDNLSIYQLDYFYNLYVILKNGLSPIVYYNQGLGVGYGNGLEDYHNGNYNYLDPTEGVPYNDGYDNGYDNGYTVGYNEGGDYVAQENISLLSVFQLIIGVMLSMLGFIINIELFGISIASVLGTLAIGIAIIWTLKLIRG